jgi:hypothetical protein
MQKKIGKNEKFFAIAKDKLPSMSARLPVQGCQMLCCQTKKPNLGKFWWVLQ